MAIYLHNTMILWLGASTLAVLIVNRKELIAQPRVLLKIVLANVIIGAAIVWWAYIAYLQLAYSHANIDWIVPLTPMSFLSTIAVGFLSVGGFAHAAVTRFPAMFVIAALAAFGAVRHRGSRPPQLLALAVVLGVSFFTLVSVVRPIMLDRTLFWTSIFVAAFAAAGLVAIPNRKLRYATLALVTGLLLANTAMSAPGISPGEDWERVWTVIGSARQPVVFVENETLGVAADQSCKIHTQAAICSVPIISVVDPAQRYEPWGLGMAKQVIGVDRVAGFITPGQQVFLVRRGPQDVGDLLFRRGMLKRKPQYTDALIAGPLQSTDFF